MLELDMTALEDLARWIDYDPLFVTVSGAHLYGFPSPDCDVDLRGCHQLPLRDLVGLDAPPKTTSRLPEDRDREAVNELLLRVRLR